MNTIPPLLLTIALATGCLGAQSGVPSAADSLIVGSVLAAENRRDASDPVFTTAATHPNATIRALASRATDRITDALHAARTEAPPLAPPPKYADPAWRLRYRALGGRDIACHTVHAALTDSVWPVRFRAMAVLTPQCTDSATLTKLRGWADALPATDVARTADGVSWHAAAHAVVALARLSPPDAARRLPRFAVHPVWQVRQYGVRAATVLGDSAWIRSRWSDRHPNVRAAAITALTSSTNPADRGRLIDFLGGDEVTVVLAAARALKDAPEPAARSAANAAFARWVGRANASERDVRVALLAVSGKPATDDQPPASVAPLPDLAIALALGAEVRLRVVMSAASGGGEFTVRTRGDVAPITAARIVALAESGYYDGLSWHRVEHDFVIQGGSPGEDEYVGSSEYFRDELGTVSHLRGTVGMSTRGHDTGDAQWFINLRDNQRLDRDYTLFAEVIDGIEVVDRILEGDLIESVVRVSP